MNDIKSITIGQLLAVYSGRPGCTCGCRGKYSANPRCKATDVVDHPISGRIPNNLRMVKRILGLLRSDPRVKCKKYCGKLIFSVPTKQLAVGERVYVLFANP